MLLYLATLHTVCLSLGHLVPSRHLAASLSGLFITATGLTSHYLIHSDDLALWVGWIRSEGKLWQTLNYNCYCFHRYISPQYWMSFPIISGEISNIKTFHCPSNPKITDDNVNIIKQVRNSSS